MPDSKLSYRESGLRFLWIALIVIVVDQVTKSAVVSNMALHESIQYAPFFNLTYVRNYGAAFSFLGDASGWQRWFFTAIALGVSGYLIYWLRHAKKHEVLLSVAFSFVLGGAIGNVYDRIMLGYVIDFLDFFVGDSHFAAFNVADSAISLGAFLLILDWFKQGDDSDNE